MGARAAHEEGGEVMGLVLIVAAAVVLIGVVALISRGARKREAEIRNELEVETAGFVAERLASKSSLPKLEIERSLLSNEPAPEHEALFDDCVDFVFMEFTRSGGRYEFSVRIEQVGETVARMSRGVGLDDLPDVVQEQFLRGEKDVTLVWQPNFRMN